MDIESSGCTVLPNKKVLILGSTSAVYRSFTSLALIAIQSEETKMGKKYFINKITRNNQISNFMKKKMIVARNPTDHPTGSSKLQHTLMMYPKLRIPCPPHIVFSNFCLDWLNSHCLIKIFFILFS